MDYWAPCKPMLETAGGFVCE
uniref:Uncharacterized protein n=1 Tax=Anguilla anguilla TaxID=7936 RepID=A0A0E9PTB2_ANGAN